MHTEKTETSHKAAFSLPPPDTIRWVKSRKAAVVRAIRDGRLTRESACQMYGLSLEEVESWERLASRYGDNALKATAIKRYRDPAEPHLSKQ